MNIYIYGDNKFKSDIKKIFKNANITMYLKENQTIEYINSLKKLKNLIQKQPTDAYLIDESKIIKSNSLKILKSKDKIEQKFLDNYCEPEYDFETIEELIEHIKTSDEYEIDDEICKKDLVTKIDKEGIKMDTIDPQGIANIDDITDEYMLQALDTNKDNQIEKTTTIDLDTSNKIDASGLQDILAQLVNNKSLEITIKIKE